MRLLFKGGSASSRCSYYSRVATIRGAASIRINTVLTDQYQDIYQMSHGRHMYHVL